MLSTVVYTVVLILSFMNEPFKCDHSIKRCWAVLSSVPPCSCFILYKVILCHLCGHGISRGSCNKVNVFTLFRHFRPRSPYSKKPARRRTILWTNWVTKFEICAMQSLLLLLTTYLRSKHLDTLPKTLWSGRLKEREGDRKLKENLRSVIKDFVLEVYCEILSYEKGSGWYRLCQ